MIAPIRTTDPSSGSTRRRMLRARMAVAAALLPVRHATKDSPGLSGWKAWLWSAWIALVAAVFLYRAIVVLVG